MQSQKNIHKNLEKRDFHAKPLPFFHRISVTFLPVSNPVKPKFRYLTEYLRSKLQVTATAYSRETPTKPQGHAYFFSSKITSQQKIEIEGQSFLAIVAKDVGSSEKNQRKKITARFVFMVVQT